MGSDIASPVNSPTLLRRAAVRNEVYRNSSNDVEIDSFINERRIGEYRIVPRVSETF